jgi:predicted nucleic acid-binding protein
MIVLIDTNVLLDVIQDRKPYSVSAARVWKLVEDRAIVGYVSAISFNNVFYIARKQAGSEKALEAVRLIRRVFQIVALDDQVIDRALTVSGNDFEDALQAAAALHVTADYLVTRNTSDFASLGVPFVTPEEFLAIVEP